MVRLAAAAPRSASSRVLPPAAEAFAGRTMRMPLGASTAEIQSAHIRSSGT